MRWTINTQTVVRVSIAALALYPKEYWSSLVEASKFQAHFRPVNGMFETDVLWLFLLKLGILIIFSMLEALSNLISMCKQN